MGQHRTSGNMAHGVTSRTASPFQSRCRKRAVPTSLRMILLSAVLVVLVNTPVFVSASMVLDAETGKECVDSDPINCPFWAENGECKANRRYMHVHCKKSCDRCKVMRVNDRNDISGIIAQRKKEIEEKRDERRKAKEALKALEAGGSTQQRDNNADGRTAATATATISSTGEVETTAPVNARDSNRKDGEKDVSTTKPNATATVTAQTTSSSTTTAATTATSSSATKPKAKPKKKKTKIDAMTGLECVDLDENCPFWAATGDCLNNKRFMSVNCRLSCDRCHIVRVRSTEEMHKFIQQKQKETEGERQAKQEAREIKKILARDV